MGERHSEKLDDRGTSCGRECAPRKNARPRTGPQRMPDQVDKPPKDQGDAQDMDEAYYRLVTFAEFSDVLRDHVVVKDDTELDRTLELLIVYNKAIINRLRRIIADQKEK